MKKLLHAVLLFAALMMTFPAASGAEEFYEGRLRAGETAYQDKHFPDAIDNLKIAAFGLLETPVLESEALVYLALAQTAGGHVAEADATLARFLEVERRFAPYAKIKLDPAVKAEFQALLLRRVAPATLLANPGLANLVETEEQKISKMSPSERVKAYEAAARREPKNPRWAVNLAREAALADDQKTVIVWASRAIEIEPSNADARALRAHAYFLKNDWTAARSDLEAMPPGELVARPIVAADYFVCLVEVKDWTPAREASKGVAKSEASRPDVVKAQQKLAATRPQSN